MFGAVWAAIHSVKEAGITVAAKAAETGAEVVEGFGLPQMLAHPALEGKLNIFPDLNDPNLWVPLLLMPLAVQWWAAWYPGAEPGGGGYIAQRMLSAKDEKNAVGATLFFNFAHYALRPWPWIIVALASLICFPSDSSEMSEQATAKLNSVEYVQMARALDDIPEEQELSVVQLAQKDEIASLKLQAKGATSIAAAFEHVDKDIIGHDIAYPGMISKLSPGMLGLVIASIIAAYMSTIGTHLNWGSSYAVNDFYKRFIKKSASEKDMVRMGRICTVVLMVFAGALSLALTDATQAFNLLLLSGAGSGAIYLLRWFWWRINAYSEIFAMVFTTVVAMVLTFGFNGEREALLDWQITESFTLDGGSVKFLIAVFGTTIAWIVGTFVTRPESQETLRNFCRICQPGGPGWKKLIAKAVAEGDMFEVVESVLHDTFTKFSDKTIDDIPFPRIPYLVGMEKYGSDKPDLRNPLFMQDASSIFANCGFKAFAGVVKSGGVVKTIAAKGCAGKSRKFFDQMIKYAQSVGSKGLGYLRFIDGEVQSPIAKFLSEDEIAQLKALGNVGDGDVMFFIADEKKSAWNIGGQVITELGNRLELIDPNVFKFCWIVDFPMFEFDENAGKVEFSHNPFSMPQGGMDALLSMDPLDVLAYQYDIVCNGVELSSGAVRNHNPELMYKAFEIAGYDQSVVDEKFPALNNAFKFGAPPHAGVAPGVDRIVMLLCDEPNIREVIAFPMNQKAQDLMMNAPGAVEPNQLRDLSLKIKLPKKMQEKEAEATEE